MYEHIIVPFDGSARAVGASLIGADLSRIFGARLLVVTASGADQGAPLQQLKDRAIEMSKESVDVWVEGVRKPARAVGVATSYRPKTLICMATHARSGLGRLVYGSVAERVVRQLDEPVLLLGPECDFRDPADFRQVILCIDGTPTSEAAVPLAAAWAHALGLRCLLLNAVDERSEPVITPDLNRYEKTLREICDVEQLRVRAANPVDGLVDVARHATGSLLVMATHGRRGFDRLRNGSAVVEVVGQSPIPVLVQRGDTAPGLDYLSGIETEIADNT